MNNNHTLSTTITLELCQEDRDRFDGLGVLLADLIDKLSNAAPAAEPTQEPAGAPAVEEKAETPATIPAQEEKPTEAPVAPQEKAKPTVTLSDIQQKVVSLSAQGAAMKKAVREVVTAYAERVSALTPEQYAEVFEKLTALEG